MPARQVQLIATLTSDTTPLAGETIAFAYKPAGSDTWIDAGTAVTDQNGEASVVITLDVPSTYDFMASYAGSDVYDSSSAELTNGCS